MENKRALPANLRAKGAGGRFLALLLACVLIFSLSACGGQKTDGSEEIEPVTVEREPEPQAAQTASEATAIALRQYLYARLLTETFLTADASSMTIEELSELVDALLLAWENAELFSAAAEELSGRALTVLEAPVVKQTFAAGRPQAEFMTLAAAPFRFSVVAYAAESGRKIDPQTWAENLTKQYDAIKGAQRYQQLARQLGTDAKAAYEQVALAQEIIRNEASEDAAFWDKLTKAAQATKTASKVGVFVVGTIVTGGGFLSALAASGWSLGQAGAVVVGGADCIVDIAATGSNIILGENHQVTVGFDDIKDKLAPVSAVVGLATFNPGETGEQLAYIGDTLTDWFFEGKVMGVQVDGGSVTARIFDSVGAEALKSALETAGYVFPETSKTLTEIMEELESDPAAALARIETLASQMAKLEQAAGVAAGAAEGAAPEQSGASAASPEPGGAESALPPAGAGEIDIFGRYAVVTTAEDGETDTITVTLSDAGGGYVLWQTEEDGEDEYEDDDASAGRATMSYDESTHTLHYEESDWTVHAVFSGSGDTVTGKGYMSGVLWEQSFYVTLDFTKISD